MRRATCTATVFAAGLTLGWYAGVDLTQRGGDEAFVVLMSSFAAMLTWTWPGWQRGSGA